ncbi:hypothetical protein [Acetomicrobium thermoterrenum]|jgi:hypothetical protein|nr:hypothetical protein [Acetomicrobium thermoterrenum]
MSIEFLVTSSFLSVSHLLQPVYVLTMALCFNACTLVQPVDTSVAVMA